MAYNTRDHEDSSFEITSKRRKGFPSETRVKRGLRIVHGDKELSEKLGRNDLCPCGSGRSFQTLLPAFRPLRRLPTKLLLSASNPPEEAYPCFLRNSSSHSQKYRVNWALHPRI